MVLAAVGQFCATSNLINNATIIRKLILKASNAGAQVLFLPEASDYIASSATESVSLAKPLESSEVFVNGIIKGLKDLPDGAIKPYISVGFHEPATTPTTVLSDQDQQQNRLKNTLLWIDPEGNVKYRYQKIHLFDVDIR